MKYIPIYIIFMFATGLFAQSQKIDSLQYLLVEQSTDSFKIRIYQELAYTYSRINLDTSLYYSDLSYEIATQNNWTIEAAKALLNKGYSQLELGDPRNSLKLFKQALEMVQPLKDTFLLASVSNNLGLAYWKLSENNIAIIHFQNANDWAHKSANEKVYDYSICNLGLISMELGRDDQAIDYFEKGKALSEEREDWASVAISYLNIGETYQQGKNYEEAYLNYQEVLKLKEALVNEKIVIALAYSNSAEVLNAQKKHIRALDNANKALALCEKYGYHERIFLAKKTKVTSLLHLKRFQEAIALSENTISDLKGSAYLDLLGDFKQVLSLCYEGKGDYKKALFWQKKYSAFQDTVSLLNRDKEIARLEISYQTKKKEAENKKLKTETRIQSELLRSRTWIAIISCIGLLLISIVSFLLLRTRKQLRLINNHLEEKVIERTEALQEINTRLHQSNDELKRFAYIASHDLKEPLRNTGGFISLMKVRLQQKKYDSLEEYMGFVERSNNQMVALVDDILEYSRLDSKGNTKQVKVDIEEEVNHVSLLLSGLLSRKNAAIHCENLPQVHCNSSLIRVVLKNIIENGIKYNERSEPRVHISSERSGKYLKLIVTDNGIGIPKDYQGRIFDMFVRLHNRSEYTGSGMGLAFCKKMMINNGGNIQVESTVGKGSTFVVSVLLNHEPELVLA